jgi:hypothetical protein
MKRKTQSAKLKKSSGFQAPRPTRAGAVIGVWFLGFLSSFELWILSFQPHGSGGGVELPPARL